MASSKYGIFGQFSDLIGPHSQVKRDVTYIYSERTFYWLSYPVYKTQKTVFVSSNRRFSTTLVFADFCWCQQKLEVLWQQTIHQEIPFYLVYKLTKFHDQNISQTGFLAVGGNFAPPRENSGTKKPLLCVASATFSSYDIFCI